MKATAHLACGGLLVLAAGFTWLALIATGGDSAFAYRSAWIYAPWLVAVAVSLLAMMATVAGHPRARLGLALTAGVAYAVTWYVWGLLEET